MKTFKVVLLVALVFVAGVVTGVVGTRVVIRRVVSEALIRPESIRPRIEHGLAFRLRLNPEQRTQLHEIITDTHEKLDSLRKEFRPQIIAVLTNADAEVSAMLTPEQQKRYEAWKGQNRPLIQAIKENR